MADTRAELLRALALVYHRRDGQRGMADFSGREDVRRWIAGRPDDTRSRDARGLASRVSLRVWPLVARGLDRKSARYFAELTLAGVRANFLAWAAAKHPARADYIRAAASSASDAVYAASAAAAAADAASAFTAAASASSYAAAAAASTSTSAPASAAYAAAAASGSASASAGRAAVWQTVSADATALETLGAALSLIDIPLWGEWHSDGGRAGRLEPSDMSPAISREWARLQVELSKRAGENWRVWLDWYDAILKGRPPWPALNEKQREDLTIAIALVEDKFWNQGPTVANREVRRLIDEALVHALPGEDELPKQVPSAAQFVVGPDGSIGLVPPGPEDRLTDTPAVRYFYSECREKALDIKQLGPQILGEILGGRIDRFLSRAPEDFSQALERDIWSIGNNLRGVRNAHVAVKDRKDLDILGHPAKLDPGAGEALGDWVETFNQLAFADPKLLARDSLRPGPQERDRTREEIALATPLVQNAIRHAGVVRADAAEELNDQQAAAVGAGEDLPGKQQTDHARSTFANFLAEALLGVYRTIHSAPSLARGEGGFVSREYFSGIYKEAGKRTFDAALIGGATAVYFSPQIVDFVLSNLDQFQAYCAVAFEHAPGAAQILRWLELSVEK